jgi:chromosome segregation ATPase
MQRYELAKDETYVGIRTSQNGDYVLYSDALANIEQYLKYGVNICDLKAEIAELQSALAERDERIRGLEEAGSKAYHIPQKYSEALGKVKELEADISNSYSVIESLGNRNQALKVENEGLKVELKGCEGDYKFEYEKRKELEAENERLKAWKTSWLLDKHYGLVQKVQELEAEKVILVNDINSSTTTFLALEARIKELTDALEWVQARYDIYTPDDVKKKVNAALGEK